MSDHGVPIPLFLANVVIWFVFGYSFGKNRRDEK